MGLYKLFSCNVEIQYKSCLLSKAMLFTLITTGLNLIIPFIIAYRSRGFWLKSHSYYEQPVIYFKYDYILIAETEDPSQPIVCAETNLVDTGLLGEENCAEIEVRENDYNGDGKNDMLNVQFHLHIPPDRIIVSVILILGLDFQLKTVCPLQMQTLAIINKDFAIPTSGLQYYGDIELYQISHLPCLKNIIDIKYNSSILTSTKNSQENVVEYILRKYMRREINTQIKTLHSRSKNGHTGSMDISAHLRVPEMQIRYIPSLLQELKWAWPQYLSLVLVFYWIFNKLKRFVFNNRLLMAWETVPWKRS